MIGQPATNSERKFQDGTYVDVYLNGVLLLRDTDYNTTTANTIGSLASLAASDIVEVVEATTVCKGHKMSLVLFGG